MAASLKPLRLLYGRTPAAEFGPKRLKAVREHMVRGQDLCRNVADDRVNRVRRFFKRYAAEELVPPGVHHGLLAVDGPKCGRTEARETEPVKPVPDAHVEASLPHLSPQIAATVRVQRPTGMCPGEVVPRRPGDIDCVGEARVGEARGDRPARHKNQWQGHDRTVPLGPKAQAVPEPFLDGREVDKPCFSPNESEA